MFPFVREYLLKEFAQNRTRDAITACTTIQGVTNEYYTTITFEECKTNETTTKNQILPRVQTSFARSPFTQLLFVVLFLTKVEGIC